MISLIVVRQTRCLLRGQRNGLICRGLWTVGTRPSTNTFIPKQISCISQHFHTSKPRPLPPILVALLKPLSRIAVVILGRRIRKWRKNMDDEQREKIRANGGWFGAFGVVLVSMGIL